MQGRGTISSYAGAGREREADRDAWPCSRARPEAPGRSAPGARSQLTNRSRDRPRGLFICSLGYDDGGLGDTVDARLGTVRRPGSVIPAPGALEVDVVERSDGFAMEP